MDYQKILEELETGERAEFDVTPEDALAFQAAWRNFPERKEIVGHAQRNGKLRYSREKSRV